MQARCTMLGPSHLSRGTPPLLSRRPAAVAAQPHSRGSVSCSSRSTSHLDEALELQQGAMIDKPPHHLHPHQQHQTQTHQQHKQQAQSRAVAQGSSGGRGVREGHGSRPGFSSHSSGSLSRHPNSRSLPSLPISTASSSSHISLPRLFPAQLHPGVPHLDGCNIDPAAVLGHVRDCLTRSSRPCVVTCNETGPALLDFVSLLLVLDEDVRSESPGSVVLFQPVMDLKAKLISLHRVSDNNSHPSTPLASPTSFPSLEDASSSTSTPSSASSTAGSEIRPQSHSPNTVQKHYEKEGGEGGDGGSGERHKQERSSSTATRTGLPGSAGRSGLEGGGQGGDPSHAFGRGSLTGILGAMVTRARCRRMATSQPASCIAATLLTECAQVAAVIAETAISQGSTRLRVASSAAGLVAAFRALRAARLLVRAQGHDILVAPHGCMENTPSAPPPFTPDLHFATPLSPHPATTSHLPPLGGAHSYTQPYPAQGNHIVGLGPGALPTSSSYSSSSLLHLGQPPALSSGTMSLDPYHMPHPYQDQQQQQQQQGVMYFNVWAAVRSNV